MSRKAKYASSKHHTQRCDDSVLYEALSLPAQDQCVVKPDFNRFGLVGVTARFAESKTMVCRSSSIITFDNPPFFLTHYDVK